MFVPKDQVGRYQKTKWFPPPFGFPTTCKALELWKKSDGYKLIDPLWQKEFTETFLENYENMIQEWVAAKIRDRSGAKGPRAWDAPNIFGLSFTLKGFSPNEETLTTLKTAAEAKSENADAKAVEELASYKLKALLTESLLYFLSYILGKEAKSSVNRTREVYLELQRTGQRKGPMSWSEAKQLILWGHEEESTLDLIEDLAVLRRSTVTHSTPLAWTIEVLALKAKLEGQNQKLTEDVYLRKITVQLTKYEKQRFLADELTTLDKLKAAAEKLDPKDMPVFKESLIRNNIKRLPVRPSSTSSNLERSGKNQEKHDETGNRSRVKEAKKGRDKAKKCNSWSKNGKCAFGDKCKFLHEEKESEKEQRPPPLRRSQRDKDVVCYKCNKKGHRSNDPACSLYRVPRGQLRTVFAADSTAGLPDIKIAPEPPTIDEQVFVLVDFQSKNGEHHEIHDTACSQYWMAKNGFADDWDISGLARYPAEKIKSRKDCVAAGCCEEALAKSGAIYMLQAATLTNNRGLMLARMEVMNARGKPEEVIVGLDTMANTTVVESTLAHNYQNDSPKVTVTVCGGVTSLGGLATLKVSRPNGLVCLRVRVGNQKQRPKNTKILLSKDHMRMLGVDVAWHLHYSGGDIPKLKYAASMRCVDVTDQIPKYGSCTQDDFHWSKEEDISRKQPNHQSRWSIAGETVRKATTHQPAVFLNADETEEDECLPEVFLSEAKIREFMERQEWKLKKPKETPLSSIDLNPKLHLELGLTQEQSQCKFRDLFVEFSDVLSQNTGLPPVMGGGAHTLNLKPDWKHVRMPEPRWTPAKKEYWTQWAKLQLESGGYERSRGRSASYGVTAFKAGPEGKHDPNWKVRPCGGYVQVNEQGQKIAQPIQRPEKTVERFAHARFFFKGDGIAAYNQVLLATGISRELLGIWTPLGVLQPTRLPFGWINAAAVLGFRVLRMLAEIPERELRDQLANHADDFMGGSATLFEGPQSLYATLRAFFDVCRKFRFTLNASKLRVGYTTETFIGRSIGDGRTRISDDNLKPIRNMQVPTDKSSLRRVLGLCVMSTPYIGCPVPKATYEGSYAEITEPLRALTGKVPWSWRPDVEQRAFDRLKTAVLARPFLHAPDYSKRFRVRLDASDFGCGGFCYQTDVDYKPEESASIPVEEMKVVKLASQSFSKTMVVKPVFYKEGYVIRWALGKQFYWYLIFSTFTTYVETDHAPLEFMKNSMKGPVSAWASTELSQLRFLVIHIPGTLNVQSDALSRYPFIRVHAFHFHGSERMWQQLLQSLPEAWRDLAVVWVYAGSETIRMARLVQEWRRPRNIILKSAPNKPPSHYDLALLAPAASQAPLCCKQVLERGTPGVCLVPSDLVNWVAVGAARQADEKIQQKVDAATKIVFLNSNCTWLIHGLEESNHQVFNLDSADDTEACRAHVRARWVRLQQEERGQIDKDFGESVVVRSDGLLMATLPGEPARIIVPRPERKPMVMRMHRELNHRSQRKIYEHLKKLYIWIGMSGDVFRWVRACPCQIVRAKMNTMHGLYRAVVYSFPGEAIAVDFQRVGESESGKTTVMSVIDICSGHVSFNPMVRRTANESVQTLLYSHVYDRGTPNVLKSDADPTLMSLIVQGLLVALKIDHIETRHYPQGNAHVERAFYMLNECLRLLHVEGRHKEWDLHMKPLSFYANSTPNENLDGLSVYEFERGWAPRLPFDSQFVEPAPDEATLPGLYGRLKRNQTLYRGIALRRRRAMRTASNEKLNEKGFKPVEYAVGDLVLVYIPPPRERASDQRDPNKESKAWKQKHKVQAVGPCEITKKISRAWYRVKDLNTGRSYKRHVSAVTKFIGDPPLVTADDKISGNVLPPPRRSNTHRLVKSVEDWTTDDLKTCGVVGVVDAPDERTVSLARAVDIRDGELYLHYFGTRSKQWRNAKFELAYIDDNSGLTILRAPKSKEKATPWTGCVPLSTEFVVATGLVFKAKRLTSASVKKLAGFVPWKC